MIAFEIEKYVEAKSIDKLAELLDLVNEPRLQVKDTGLKYRVINHWSDKELIRYHRTSELNTRKFSFIDFIWIKAINELRTLGVKIEVLQDITKEIYTNIPSRIIFEIHAENIESLQNLDYKDKDGYFEFLKSGEYKNIDPNESNLNINLLQLLITQAISERTSVSIIVYKDGGWLPFVKENEHLYDADLLHKKEFTSHIRINLTEIIFNFLAEDQFGMYAENFKFFSFLELYILSLVRQGNFKKITINKKNKTTVVIKNNKAAHKNFIEEFKKKDYEDFDITDKNNKVFMLNEEILINGYKKNKTMQEFDFKSTHKFQYVNIF